MKKILLVNPPIYDFSAYDFWLKPYGLLRVAGWLRDGEACRDRVDLDEPLSHNKFFFSRTHLGPDRVQEFKSLCRDLNRGIRSRECMSTRKVDEAIVSNSSSY